MQFTSDQVDKLKQIWKNKDLVTIKGVNSYGDEFETTGRITSTDENKAGVFDKTVYLEFGVTKKNKNRKQTAYFAPFQLNSPEENDLSLHVLSIDHNGKTIFENADQDKIKEAADKNNQKSLKKLQKEGRDQLPECPVVDSLKQMVGKPVELDGYTGVLIGVKGVTYTGNPMVDIASGPLVGGINVKEDSVLSTESNTGNKDIIASNVIAPFRHNTRIIQEKIAEKTGNLSQ